MSAEASVRGRKRRGRKRKRQSSKENADNPKSAKRICRRITRSSGDIKTFPVKKLNAIILSSDDDDEDNIKMEHESNKKQWTFPSQFGHPERSFTFTYQDEHIEISENLLECVMFKCYVKSFSSKLKKNSYVLTSSFMPLLKKDVTKAERCYKKIGQKIFERKYIFIPYCDKIHWYLIIVITTDKCILILDSNKKLFRHYHDMFQDIIGWIEKETGKTNWRRLVPDVPQQPNAIDCGVYLLQSMEKIGKDEGFTDTSSEAKLNRKKWYCQKDVQQYRENLTKWINNL